MKWQLRPRGFGGGLRPIVSTAGSSDAHALVRHRYAPAVIIGQPKYLLSDHVAISEFSLLSHIRTRL